MRFDLDDDDIALAEQLYTGDFDETLVGLIQQRADEVRIEAFIEEEGDVDSAYQWEAAFEAEGSRSAQPEGSGDGYEPDAGNAREGAANIEELRGAEFSRLGLDHLTEEESLWAFAESNGPGVDAQIESIGHDLEMMFDPPEREVAPPLDHAADPDPNIASRQRQEAQLRADSPLQGGAATGQAQDGVMGLGLFDAADQPQFRLDGPDDARSFDDIMKSLDEEDADIAAARACTQPKKGKPE